jgi:hypothetical protein
MRLAAIGVAALALASNGLAQNITGSVTGRVTDSAGATVPDVALVLTNVGTNLAIPSRTVEDGNFAFPLLQPGKYRLSAEKTGFKKYATEVFSIDVDQVQRLDIALKVGDVTETVTVLERPTLVESETSSLGQVITTREIEELPMNGRNPMSVAEFAPGFQPMGGFGDGLNVTRAAAQMVGTSNFTANGGVTGNNEILLDGVPMTVCCQGQAVLIPSADTVSQVKVQTNSSTAEFGRTSGGVLNMVTKSGTNQFHGSAFEFFRNEQLDAANFFTNRSAKTPIPGRHDFRGPLRFNQFGVTAGGPLVLPRLYDGHNRTFFFLGWEGTHTRTPSYASGLTPPTALRSGDFSESPFLMYDPTTVHRDASNANVRDPFPNKRIPSNRISPIAQAYLKFFPQPDIPGIVQNFSWMARTTTDDNQGNIKIDHNFNEANRFFARFSASNNTYTSNDWVPNGPTGVEQFVTAHTFVMDYVRVLKSSMVLDTRYAFAKQRNKTWGACNLFDAADYGFSKNFLSQQAFTALPLLTVTGYRALGNQGRRDWDHYTHALNSSLTWLHGGHTVRFGWDGRMFIDNTVSLDSGGGTFTFTGAYTKGPGPNVALPVGSQPYYAMASYLLGIVESGSLLYRDSVARNQLYSAVFIQDDWRATRKLTLNIGLRYELETGFKERYDRQSSFNPDILSPLSQQVEAKLGRPVYGAVEFAGLNGYPRGLWATAHNWGPRIGFAYSITPRTVIRTGFGITYFPTTQRAYLVSSGQGYSVTNNVTVTLDSVNPIASFADPFPPGYPVVRPTGNSQGRATGWGSNPNGGVFNAANSYVEQWNFGIQRELTASLVVGISYAGGHGVKLPLMFDANDVNPALYGDRNSPAAGITALQRQMPNPFYGLIDVGNFRNQTMSFQALNARFPQYSTLRMQYMPWGKSAYNSIQISATKSMRNGLSMRLALTMAKSLGNVNNLTTADSVGEGNANYQNAHAMAIERSVATTDIPRRLALNATYDLPFGKGRKFASGAGRILNGFVGGWQTNWTLTAQSGMPLMFTATGLPSYGGSRPSYRSLSPDAYSAGGIEQRLGGISGGSGYLNPAVFRLPASFEFGDVPRVNGDFRAPWPINVNMSINKSFRIREGVRLQFRGEAFNPFNHPVFGTPNAQYGSTSFGVISGQGNRPRNIQLGLKLLW